MFDKEIEYINFMQHHTLFKFVLKRQSGINLCCWEYQYFLVYEMEKLEMTSVVHVCLYAPTYIANV